MAHTIPGKLRIARNRTGLPAWRAAREIGVSRATLTHWETGRHAPQPAQERALLAFYRKTISRLAKG